MKTNFKSFALAAAVLLGMGACSNELDEQLQQAEGQPLTFNFSIHNGAVTKTTTNPEDRMTTWSSGDEVGLFVYKKDAVIGTAEPIHANVKVKYDGSKWTAESPVVAGEEYDFYAYYPYQAAASDPTQVALSAKADQSQEADYNLSDVMAAPKTTVSGNDTELNLTFNHVFSLVEIQVSGDLVKAAPAKVVLTNVKTASSLNLADNQAAVSGEAVEVTPQALGEKEGVYAYRAVVPAQTVAANTRLVQLQNGEKHYGFKYSTEVAYEAGRYRTLRVLINEAKSELIIPTPGITPWEPSKPGSGEGGTEEIVPPVELITSFSLPFDAPVSFTELTGVWKADGSHTRADAKADTWYHRENKIEEPATNAVVADGTLKLTNPAGKRGAWNNSNVVFRKYGKFELTTYKVTITVTSTMTTGSGDKGSEGIVGIGISNSNDDKYFHMYNDKGTTWSRTVTTYNKINSTADVSKTFFIDCSEALNDGKSANVSSFTKTTEEDVANGLNVVLYNYTNDDTENTIVVKSVKIEKAELPAAAN